MRESTSFAVAILAVCLAITVPVVLQPDTAHGDAFDKVEEAQLQELRLLREAQEQTATSLDRLSLALEQAQAPSIRQPLQHVGDAALEEGVTATLIASLDALRMSIEEEAMRTQDLLRRSPAGAGESLVETRRRNKVTLWRELEVLEQTWRVDADAANRSQQFQTARDLLQAYGPPTEIFRPKGGVLFYYRHHPPGMPGPAWYFRLQDDMVIEFFLEDEVMEEESE